MGNGQKEASQRQGEVSSSNCTTKALKNVNNCLGSGSYVTGFEKTLHMGLHAQLFYFMSVFLPIHGDNIANIILNNFYSYG